MYWIIGLVIWLIVAMFALVHGLHHKNNRLSVSETIVGTFLCAPLIPLAFMVGSCHHLAEIIEHKKGLFFRIVKWMTYGPVSVVIFPLLWAVWVYDKVSQFYKKGRVAQR